MPLFTVIVYAPGESRNARYDIEAKNSRLASASAKRMFRRDKGLPNSRRVQVVSTKRENRNPSMKTPKLGKWIKAHRVRVTKKNGVKVLEIQRTVKKTIRRAAKRKRR